MTTMSSQVANPWNATKRTIFAVSAVAYPVLIILAQILQMFAETYAAVLPGEIIAWAFGAATFLTLTAGLVTRIMAIPAVNTLLATIGMEAKAAEPPAPVIEYKTLTNIPDYPNK